MEKQPELYMHRAPGKHSVHCNNRRDLDKYATRLIKGSSAKEAFISSFSSGDLTVAIYIRNSCYTTTETRQIFKALIKTSFCFYIYTSMIHDMDTQVSASGFSLI